MTYAEKLRHPLWQKKRAAILARDNFKCSCCGATEKPIQVTHVVFVRSNCPWEYADNCYQTLCEDCQSERQEILDKAANALRLAVKDVPTDRLAMVAQKLAESALENMGGQHGRK